MSNTDGDGARQHDNLHRLEAVILNHPTTSRLASRGLAVVFVIITVASMKTGTPDYTPFWLLLTGISVLSMYVVDGVTDNE